MRKGFTLIELLIVIGILATLATTTVLILNPAQILAQTRDGQRFSDLNNLKKALALYLVRVSPLPANALGLDFSCYAYSGSGLATCTTNSRFTSVKTTVASVPSKSVDGNGWIPVNLLSVLGGSPISVLPVDPSHGATYYYAYAASSTSNVFELNADLESQKYTTAPNDKEGTDGGSNPSLYEAGTNLGL